MPLAAHATWHGQTLRLDAALGSGEQPALPLMRTRVEATVGSDDEASALGARAVQALQAAGAARYLGSS
jgi:hydroxymethylbilane synthase